MSKKSGKVSKGIIVLAIIVVYFVAMGVKNKNIEKTLDDKILNEVTIVTDGKIHPENEGKLVLVTGKITFEQSASFPELNRDLNTFKISRVVRDYVKDGDSYDWVERETAKKPAPALQTAAFDDYYDDDYYYDYEGSGVFQAAVPQITTDNLFTEVKTVPVKVGEFDLGEDGLDLVDDLETFRDKDATICGLSFTGLYFSNPEHKDEEKPGDVSLDYSYYDMSKSDKLTVLAKQSGSTFADYEIDGKKVFKVLGADVNSREALAASLEKTTKSNFKLRIVFVVMILAVGALFIKGGKSKKAENEEPAAEAEPAESEAPAEETEETENTEE